MKIDFVKISGASDININFGNINFQGTLKKKDLHSASLNGTLNGTLKLNCDICDTDLNVDVSTNIDLILHNGTLKINEIEDLNIIECEDSIDLDHIIHTEIESIKLDYHYCDKCKND